MNHLYFLLAFAYCSGILGQTKDDSPDLASITSHVAQLESGLRSTMNALQKTMDDLEATKTELRVTKAQLNKTASDLQATKTELALKTQDVSFHVHLAIHVTTTKNQPIIFNVVHHNAGSGYNTTTGKFTAPISGTYIFSTDIEMEIAPLYRFAEIVQSGSVVSSGYGQTSSDNKDVTVSVTAITHARQGEQVWVTTTDDVYLYGGGFGYPTHFVGALLSVD